MTETPAITVALRALRQGKPIRQAADESALEVGEVVAGLLADWRKTPIQQVPRPASTSTQPGWEAYLQHPSPKVVKAAERLRDVFAAEDAKSQLLTRKRQLEAELAKVKAELSGSKTTGSRPAGAFPCGHCERVMPNKQGLALHRKAAHPGVDAS